MIFMVRIFRSLRIRLGVIMKVLFVRHWILVSLSEENIESLFKDRSFEVEAEYIGMRKYIINKLFYKLSEGIDENSLLLKKDGRYSMGTEVVVIWLLLVIKINLALI